MLLSPPRAPRAPSWRELRRALAERLTLAEASGSLGDLGTFIPLLLGMHARGAVAFVPALFWTGAFNLVTGLVWDMPMPVQPMKTIAAVAITDGLTETETIAAGMLVSGAVLLLGLTRGIGLVHRVVPVAVVRGLQLGLGLALVRRAAPLVFAPGASWLDPASGWLLGVLSLLGTLCMLQREATPAALVIFALGLAIALALILADVPPPPAADGGDGGDGAPPRAAELAFAWTSPLRLSIARLRWADVGSAAWKAALPQLPLTTLNSVISVCKLADDLSPERSVGVTHTSVAISVGLLNLIGCPLGGMPSCHGAGGLAGQWRFGARTGASVVLLGAGKMLVAVFAGSFLLALLSRFPHPILGTMLTFSGLELATAGLRGAPDPKVKGAGDAALVTLATAGFTVSMGTGIGCVAGLLVAAVHAARDELGARWPRATTSGPAAAGGGGGGGADDTSTSRSSSDGAEGDAGGAAAPSVSAGMRAGGEAGRRV